MSGVLEPAAAARLRRVGGDRLLRQMIELFLEHTPARIATAEAALAGALQEVERACHSLKTSAGNLGAHALQASAQAAESAAAAQDRAAAAHALKTLRDDAVAAMAAARVLLAELEA